MHINVKQCSTHLHPISLSPREEHRVSPYQIPGHLHNEFQADHHLHLAATTLIFVIIQLNYITMFSIPVVKE